MIIVLYVKTVNEKHNYLIDINGNMLNKILFKLSGGIDLSKGKSGAWP